MIVRASRAYHAMPRSLKVSIRPPIDSKPSIVSSANVATGFMVPLFGVELCVLVPIHIKAWPDHANVRIDAVRNDVDDWRWRLSEVPLR